MSNDEKTIESGTEENNKADKETIDIGETVSVIQEEEFTPEITPHVKLILDSWNLSQDDAQPFLFVTGLVETINITAELKRGSYNKDSVRGHVQFSPDDLHWSTVIEGADAEILSSGTDCILRIVTERLARSLTVAINEVHILFEKEDKDKKESRLTGAPKTTKPIQKDDTEEF